MSSVATKLKAEIGVPEPTAAPKKTQARTGEASVFDLANQVDTIEVLDWLGIEHHTTDRGEIAVCPGCHREGPMVEERGFHGGLKCLFATCADCNPKPERAGFRSNVTLAMLVKNIAEPLDAAKAICAWKGIKVPEWTGAGASKATTGAAPTDEPSRTDGREPPSRATTIPDVLDEWRAHGPLIHEPTGIARLDELTDGGPVYGSRWYFAGAPDAGKTALLVQLAHIYALRGVAVGLLAVDEEAGDLVTRLGQRLGHDRRMLEIRSADTLASLRRDLADLPIRFYDGTIESAAADLATYARERAAADPAGHPHGPRAMLGIDSLQTVTCDAEIAAQRSPSTTEAVTARVYAIRAVATRYRMITLATSEMGRGAYAGRDPEERTATLAASKWSGAIEYSARVLLGLRSVAGESDLLEIEIAKNKHGPTGELVHLRIDRRCQTLREVSYDAPPSEHGEAERDSHKAAKLTVAAAHVALVIVESPGIVTRKLPPAARARASMSEATAAAALALLGAAVVTHPAPRGAQRHYLDGSRVPAAVLAAVPEGGRAAVEASRPPADPS